MSEKLTIPPSWVQCTLGDVVDYGATAKAEPDEIPPDAWILELEDIEKDTSKLLQRVSFEERNSKSTKTRFEAGDVLYGKLRPYLNKVILADRPGYCTTEILPLRPPEGVSSSFLFYWLRHPSFLEYVTAVSHGLNMPRLGTEAGKAAPLVLAPTVEQRRIGDKLDTLLARVCACRERLDRVPGIVKRFRQAVLAAATSGELTQEWRLANDIADTWSFVELGSVASDFSYGTAAKSSPAGSVPVLRMGNIQDGELDWSDLVYTSDSAEIVKYRLSPGDVLFNRTNSPELVGKTAVYWGEREAVYAGYLIRVRCGDRLLPDFLNYCLGSPKGRDYCWQVKSDGVSQSNINAKKLAAFQLRLPTVAEQREIVLRTKALLGLLSTLIGRHSDASATVKAITPSILSKAFRGELIPQDPDDAPASKLLARLRAGEAPAVHTRRPNRVPSRQKTSPRPEEETTVLTRSVIQPGHLSEILLQRGPLTAEELWKASQLEIDEFYEQLKEEEVSRRLRELRGPTRDDVRRLEATT